MPAGAHQRVYRRLWLSRIGRDWSSSVCHSDNLAKRESIDSLISSGSSCALAMNKGAGDSAEAPSLQSRYL